MTVRKDRPIKGESRAERPNRARVSGYRDVLSVRNKNEDYHYRWVLDSSQSGSRILLFQEGGWELVNKDVDNVVVGEDHIAKTEDLGTLVRVPAGKTTPDQYLYLMRIPKEWYDEDKYEEEKELRAREARVFRQDERQGQYLDVDKRDYGPDR